MTQFQLQGIGVAPGIAIGRAQLIRRWEVTATGVLLADEESVRREVEQYQNAVHRSIEELEVLMDGQPAEVAEMLGVQIVILEDPQWEDDVLARIVEDKKNAGDAVLEVMRKWMRQFREMEGEYFQEKDTDMEDIGRRMLKNLGRGEVTDDLLQDFDVILVAADLNPSDLISRDSSRVVGFATRAGGTMSHVAIVARLRGLVAVAGCGIELEPVADGDWLVLDGEAGVVLVNPEPAVIEQYREKRKEQGAASRSLRSLKNKAAVTTDGTAIELLANIGSIEDMEAALEQGAQGVGLLRTELLFMQSNSLPTEEEQFIFYKNILVRAGGRAVTIRTLDIGGDKALPYLPLPKEENPFLGYRAIRISLDRPDLFLTQVRAILRASAFGRCRILLPMISHVEEVLRAKELIAEAREELMGRQLAFDPRIAVGIMIEVPAAALIADQLAEEVDFFSIGTNDLCQYTLAVDRMNEKIKALYDPFHPGLLRLIRYVIFEAQGHCIPVGMCGEMAGDPKATLLLLGMGLEEFSMNAASIPVIKNIILNNSMEKARAVCEDFMGKGISGLL
ncbi:MAG TPA: phosphoenolpyruvate--protein phosphotransferase [Puia sp.]|jgi:phosphotransferase system enzyme I (PtsI)|nr:phosphoenolpyruvate--protein phosphotransferase [Puia sp.]